VQLENCFVKVRSEVIEAVFIFVWNFTLVWHVVFINRYHFLERMSCFKPEYRGKI